MAKILVLQTEGEANTIVTLTGYGDFLKKIAGHGEVKEVTRELLFKAKPCNVTYNNCNIITKVTRDYTVNSYYNHNLYLTSFHLISLYTIYS